MKLRFCLPFILLLLPLAGCAPLTPAPCGERIISNVVYARRSTGPLHLDIYLPARPAPHPLVIWIHGGGWKYGDKGWMLHLRRLTRDGFAVASVQYRLSGTAKYPAALDDCRDALNWLLLNGSAYGLDTGHIFLSGGSAGGHLAALLALETGRPEIRAVCLLYPATDLNGFGNQGARHGYLPDFLGAPVNQLRTVAIEASPVHHVARNAPPFIIFHGDKDTLVPIKQSEELISKLRAEGIDCRLIVVHGKGHGFALSRAELEQAAGFLKAHMN